MSILNDKSILMGKCQELMDQGLEMKDIMDKTLKHLDGFLFL